MASIPLPVYEARILPALHRIQSQYGYLNAEAMSLYAASTGTPEYKLQAVASFFPHFRMQKPPALTVRVCRDMACHMAGSDEIVRTLSALQTDDCHVEGVSCLGRCDRAPAAAVDVQALAAETPEFESDSDRKRHEHVHEFLYLNATAAKLRTAIDTHLHGRGVPTRPDTDTDHPRYQSIQWTIDPYHGGPHAYAGVVKAVALRNASLDRAAKFLSSEMRWSDDRARLFTEAARRRMPNESIADRGVLDAVRAWQTEESWAQGQELGGWADPILAELDSAKGDLRGMGGAGIPATQKWTDVRDAVRNARVRRMDDRAFIIVNADESEPATFKDRELLLRAPHLIVEGVILAGLITEATQGFIYIRHEYAEQIEAVRKEIQLAESLGMCGTEARVLGRSFPISVFVSPGGYICGEQSALVEAMSDHRGEPRNLPPKLETNGLEDRPTLVSNVETFAWAPYIWINGGEAYAKLGANGWRGMRFFSVCGDVNRPGVYEVPMGLTVRELLLGDQYCRGIKGGRKLKAFAPSGPSGGFLPAVLTGDGLPGDLSKNREWSAFAKRRGLDPAAREIDVLDLELELNLFRALSPTQMLGAGLVVYAEGRDMVEQAVNALEFYRNESCGKCVPCRLGSKKLATLGRKLLEKKITRDEWENLGDLIEDLDEALSLTSICGLGRSVPIALRTATMFFGEDIDRHLVDAVEDISASPVGVSEET